VGRPGAKEGGRREEERRSEIPAGDAGGLHSRETFGAVAIGDPDAHCL
jgi:hypothetical protein